MPRALLLAFALAAVPGEPVSDPEARATALKRVSEQIICQCSCNMILSECSHQSCPFALPERKKIAEAIAAGRDDQAIIAGYVEKYGRSILSAPPTAGGFLDRLAWLLPGLLLAVGAGIVIYVIRLFTSRSRAHSAVGVASGEDPYLQQVERDLGAGPEKRS